MDVYLFDWKCMNCEETTEGVAVGIAEKCKVVVSWVCKKCGVTMVVRISNKQLIAHYTAMQAEEEKQEKAKKEKTKVEFTDYDKKLFREANISWET